MIRTSFVFALILCFNSLLGQEVDTPRSQKDSTHVTPFLVLPSIAAGFVTYEPPSLAFKNTTGFSSVNAFGTGAPGFSMDGLPFPQIVNFRALTTTGFTPVSPAVVWDG